jgi:hypothetical protein
MYIIYTLDKCPCGAALEMHLFGFCSRLGPPGVLCRSCRSQVESGRAEWPDMNWQARGWFLGTSLVYVGIVGFLGGYSYGATRDYWFQQPHEMEGMPDYAGPVFLTGILVWGGVVVLVQGYRVLASIWRSIMGQSKSSRGFWNLQTGLQGKFIILLLLVPFVAWVIWAVQDWQGTVAWWRAWLGRLRRR